MFRQIPMRQTFFSLRRCPLRTNFPIPYFSVHDRVYGSHAKVHSSRRYADSYAAIRLPHHVHTRNCFGINYRLLTRARVAVTVNRVTSACLGIRGQSKNCRPDSSNTDVQVVISITGDDPIPPEGGMFRHRSG
ncbi:hypothetical protein AVEN_78758-1 [Araneus ventricosus]|uniref:Uncharacterized protein n=1 Tax=Araneus ventricosus TaxID=182803 RepID=A0A4Y2NQW8_ARAVE|nr:hypothetical protein AVEN_78758-1 [Araneus ventricosus]